MNEGPMGDELEGSEAARRSCLTTCKRDGMQVATSVSIAFTIWSPNSYALHVHC